MHYLGLALYAEGAGDYQFLRPLLQRLCENICLNLAERSVDVSDVIPLDHPHENKDDPRFVRILNAARFHAGAWRIIFVHGDGSGDSVVAREELVRRGIDAIRMDFPECVGVGVVPVRETEAWAICDGDALREVFGTALSDDLLGIPASARGIETDIDPKLTLRNAFMRTNPSPQRGRHGVGAALNALGATVRLERLRMLPSFRALEVEVTAALTALGVLR